MNNKVYLYLKLKEPVAAEETSEIVYVRFPIMCVIGDGKIKVLSKFKGE